MTVAVVPLASQVPVAREPIEAWHAALGTISSVDSLRQLHRTTKARADSLRGDPLAEVRLGVVDLHLGARTGQSRYYTEATSVYGTLAEDYPEWGYPRYGLGLALIGEAHTGSTGFGLKRMLGLDPAAEIVREMVASTGPDSTALHWVVELGNHALRTREGLDEEVALRTLRQMPARAMARRADVALIRARLEREAGEKDSATAVIERAARLHRDDAQVLRAQAQMRFVVGRSDGAGPWYRGLGLASGEAMYRYRRDLELVVPDSILAELDSVAAGDREGLLRGYWASQDPDGLPTENDRLAEHYRRLEFARHHYVRHSLQRVAPIHELDTLGIDTFDARGKTMLRHGSPWERTAIGNSEGPEVRVTLRIVGMPPNESWAYRDTDGSERFYHFAVLDDGGDFVPLESILDLLAQSAQFKRFRRGEDPAEMTIKTWGAELVSEVAQELFRSRQELSPLYTRMFDAGLAGADSLQALEREIGHLAALKPYSYELGFELPMNGSIDILAVGSDRVGPILQLSFAIPGSDVTPHTLQTRGVVYPVRMRVAVVDRTGETVVQVDTVRGFVAPRRLARDQYLLGQLPLRVPPGEYRVRASLEADRRGMLSRPTTVVVAAPAAGALSLSDVSIGIRSVRIAWPTPGADTAWANPLHRFPADEPMQLYFEVGGLTRGTEYGYAVAIDRAAEVPAFTTTCSARGTTLTLGFRQEHSGGVDRVARAVSLERLRPDDYVLAITVSTSDGQQVTRCRHFTVTRP
jgi:hypothetical protein